MLATSIGMDCAAAAGPEETPSRMPRPPWPFRQVAGVLCGAVCAASPAAGGGGGGSALHDPDPVIGWPRSPLADLPALPKVHLSWGLAGVPYNSSSPTQVDFARITHSLPIRVPVHGDSLTFRVEDTDCQVAVGETLILRYPGPVIRIETPI